MKVWIAKWDVRNGGEGVEVYASQKLAVDAVLGYAKEMSLIGDDMVPEDATRKRLLTTGVLEFASAECYYRVEEHHVRIELGSAQDEASGDRTGDNVR